jgi:hypothetical protein
MRRLFIGFGLIFAGAAHSATVTQCGPNICYEYDDAQVAAGSGYFGTPTLIGDDMRFLPTSYKAQSIDGVGDNTGTNTDNYSSTFVFDRIYSISGDEIASIDITERGDYSIVSEGNVSANLLMLVGNNSDATECECDLDTLAFNAPTALALWELNTGISPVNTFDSIANDVSLSLQNTMSAFTDASGETAWIQKKFVSVSVSLVPVPAAVWLMGSALGVIFIRLRKPRGD